MRENSVSAGWGPRRSRPSLRRRSSTGSMMSISSRPKWPDSPAWGLRPATAIRGRAMPNLRCRSACRMRITSMSRSGVMASAMARKGRWVVASATRRPPPASIMTTRCVPLRSARYSVWPVKAKPASLMMPLCTGAVTTAGNDPSRQPARAASSRASTWALLRVSSVPAVTAAAAGMWRTCSQPGWCAGAVSPQLKSTAMPSRAARSRSTSTSPRTDSRHGRGCCDRAMHRSGPIPAGSPAVRARWGKSTASSRNPGRSVDRADFDIGRVADLAHPVLEGLIALAFADGLARQQLLAFLRDVLIASLKDLDQVPAERGLDGVADLAGLQRVHGFLEFGDGVARIDPAEVAAFGGAGILGLQTRHILEFRAVFDAFLELQQAVAGVGFRGEFVGLDEDMARVRLRHGERGIESAFVDELEDVETIAASQDRADLARLHRFQRIGEQGLNLAAGAPAEVTALQRVGGVGIAGRHLGEIGALGKLGDDVLGTREACLDLLW